MTNLKEYGYEEIAEHCNEEDCWIVIEDIVYNPTKFLEKHPGGPLVIASKAGRNATKAFKIVGHSKKALGLMEEYKIGKLKPGSKPVLNEDNEATFGLKHGAILATGLILAGLLHYYLNFMN